MRLWFLIGLLMGVVAFVACSDDDSGNNTNNNNAAGTCGDGVIDSDEECDDGSANSDITPDACRTDCRQAYCGDAVVDTGEDCDDGDDGTNRDDNCFPRPAAMGTSG